MSLIDGIGGVILFSSKPKELAQWYKDVFSLEFLETPDGTAFYKSFEYRDLTDSSLKRSTTWAIVKGGDNLAGAPRTCKVNYRVREMGKVLEALKAKGVAIESTEEHSYGKFATLSDPEGNKIELFEEAEERV